MTIPKTGDAWVQEIVDESFAIMALDSELPALSLGDSELIELGIYFGLVATILSLQKYGRLDDHFVPKDPFDG